MAAFLVIFGIVEFVGGLLVFAGAKSAIHEILGTLAMGFAVLTFGQAAQLVESRRVRDLLERMVVLSPRA